jgi:hypothetical protein
MLRLAKSRGLDNITDSLMRCQPRLIQLSQPGSVRVMSQHHRIMLAGSTRLMVDPKAQAHLQES